MVDKANTASAPKRVRVVLKEAEVDAQVAPLVAAMNKLSGVTTLRSRAYDPADNQEGYVVWVCGDEGSLVRMLRLFEVFGLQTQVHWNAAGKWVEYSVYVHANVTAVIEEIARSGWDGS